MYNTSVGSEAFLLYWLNCSNYYLAYLKKLFVKNVEAIIWKTIQ